MSHPDPQPQLEYPYAAQQAAKVFHEPLERAPVTWELAPTWLALTGVAIACLTANFAVVPLMEVFSKRDAGAVLVYYSMGIIAAEPFILACWLAWGGGSFFRRLGVHWAAGTVLAMVWLAGAILTEGFGDGDIREFLEIVPFSLPLFSLTVQIPLWIARHYFGWRLVDDCADAAPIRPLAIRDLMIGTVIVAISFAGARLAEGMDRNSEGWLVWAILAPSVAGICLVSVLPVAAWMLRSKNLMIGLICIPIQTAVAIMVTTVAVTLVEGGRIDLWELTGIGIIIVSFAATLTAAALAARAAGFRLQIG